MGFSESDSSNCRKHPNQKQLPGICSSCLREKLSNLNASSPSFTTNPITLVTHESTSHSSSPPYTAAGARKSTGNRHRRNGSEVFVSVGMVFHDELKKSRSVSCTRLSKNREDNIGNDVNMEKIIDVNEKKKDGFLKRLINSTSKKTKRVLMHSKPMNETSYMASSIATQS